MPPTPNFSVDHAGIANVHVSTLRALQAVQAGQQEQMLIERTLGQAFLAKLQGENVDLLATYRKLGGKDGLTEQMLGAGVSAAFNKLSLQCGINAIRQQAISVPVRGAATSKKIQASAVASLPGQALHTLVSIAGPEFATEHGLSH